MKDYIECPYCYEGRKEEVEMNIKKTFICPECKKEFLVETEILEFAVYISKQKGI